MGIMYLLCLPLRLPAGLLNPGAENHTAPFMDRIEVPAIMGFSAFAVGRSLWMIRMNRRTVLKEGVEKHFCTVLGKTCAGAFYGHIVYWAGYLLYQRRFENKEDMTASGTLDRESGKWSFKNY